jgi:hypothetical protein
MCRQKHFRPVRCCRRNALAVLFLLPVLLGMGHAALAQGALSIQPQDAFADAEGVIRFSVHASGVPAPGLRSYALKVNFTGPDVQLVVGAVDSTVVPTDAVTCSGELLTGPKSETIDPGNLAVLQSGQGQMTLDADLGEGVLCADNSVDSDGGSYVCGPAGTIAERTGYGSIIDFVCYVGADVPGDALVDVELALYPGLDGAILLDGPPDPIIDSFVSGRLHGGHRPNADIDGNGVADALSDGILTIRYEFGFRGDSLTEGVVQLDCTRCTAEEIEPYLESLMP